MQAVDLRPPRTRKEGRPRLGGAAPPSQWVNVARHVRGLPIDQWASDVTPSVNGVPRPIRCPGPTIHPPPLPAGCSSVGPGPANRSRRAGFHLRAGRPRVATGRWIGRRRNAAPRSATTSSATLGFVRWCALSCSEMCRIRRAVCSPSAAVSVARSRINGADAGSPSASTPSACWRIASTTRTRWPARTAAASNSRGASPTGRSCRRAFHAIHSRRVRLSTARGWARCRAACRPGCVVAPGESHRVRARAFAAATMKPKPSAIKILSSPRPSTTSTTRGDPVGPRSRVVARMCSAIPSRNARRCR